MRNITKLTGALLVSALVTACGGGTSGSNDDTPAFGRADPKIEFLPVKPSLLTNPGDFPIEANSPYFTQLNVKITDDNGFSAPGNTIVELQVSNVEVASIGIPDDPSTNDVNEGLIDFVGACLGTNAGIASYFIRAGAVPGTVNITAGITAPLTSGTVRGGGCQTQAIANSRPISRTLAYTVNQGPAPFQRLSSVPNRSNLLVNTLSAVPTNPSPFVATVEVTQRDALGALVNGAREIVVTVEEPDLLALSNVDDLATADVNEFTLLRNIIRPVLISGRNIFYVHSRQRTGTGRVTIRGIDPITAAEVTQTISFTVGNTAQANQPASLLITAANRPTYIANSNGTSTLPVQVRSVNDLGESVSDPTTGVNNILVEIVNPSGETLSAVNAAGAAVEAVSVRGRTQGGTFPLVFKAGTRQGLIQIRATTDRLDNNIDNGVQQPITSTRSVVVSDGRLFDLKITSSIQDSLRAREVEVEDFRPGQNGTYGFLVTAVGTDRQGNPVLPGTVVEFGLIDSPTTGYPTQGAGTFQLAGNDGNPVEGGTRFTAVNGAFTTAGGGAGAGDTLLNFGEQSAPIRDLEAARTVARINGPTSLDIAAATRFNLNDDTLNGVAVDRGPVVPYVIGRATIGNVSNNSGVTNQFGAVSTTINYPVSRIGHVFGLWARGIGDTPPGQTTPELVTDVELLRFPAAREVEIAVAPSAITAAVSSPVQICLRDAFANPVPSAYVTYGFSDTFGTVDGRTDGIVANPTGADGCTFAVVKAVQEGEITFSALDQSATVDISDGADNVLFAIPSLLGGNGGRVTLRLLNAFGEPISGIQIGGSCSEGAGFSSPPGATNANGETTADIIADLNGVGQADSAECEFTAPNAEPATVQLEGIDICGLGLSPVPQGCPTTPTPTPVARTLTVRLLDETGNTYPSTAGLQVQVIGNAGGINCVSTNTTNNACIGAGIADGTVVSLTASVGINGAPTTASFCRWTGESGCFGTQPAVQINVTGGNKTCNAVFSTTGPAGCPAQQ